MIHEREPFSIKVTQVEETDSRNETTEMVTREGDRNHGFLPPIKETLGLAHANLELPKGSQAEPGLSPSKRISPNDSASPSSSDTEHMKHSSKHIDIKEAISPMRAHQVADKLFKEVYGNEFKKEKDTLNFE